MARSLLNSLIIAVLQTVGQLVLGSCAATASPVFPTGTPQGLLRHRGTLIFPPR